jgi:hypothetical protein
MGDSGYTAGTIIAGTSITAASTPVGTFKVSSNGSISIYNAGYVGVSGSVGSIGISGTSADKPFRINYRSKDGSDKTETVQAITLENAKSMIKDLDFVNYHIEG